MAGLYAPPEIAEDLARQAVALARARAQAAAARPNVPTSVLEWAARYRRIDGQRFSLARFAPLQAIYADEHPHSCVIKPAQRGVSEWAINYTGFALDVGTAAWAPAKAGL